MSRISARCHYTLRYTQTSLIGIKMSLAGKQRETAAVKPHCQARGMALAMLDSMKLWVESQRVLWLRRDGWVGSLQRESSVYLLCPLYSSWSFKQISPNSQFPPASPVLTTLQDSLNHRLQLWLNKVDRQGISLSNYTYLLLFEAIHCGWMLLCNFPWGMAVSCYRNKARCEFVHESRCGAWYTQLPLHEPQHISLPDLQAAVLLWGWMKYCLFNLCWWY